MPYFGFSDRLYLEKSIKIKSSFVQGAFEEYIDVIDIIDKKSQSEGRVLTGELLPFLFSELSNISQIDEEKVMHAWYVLYAATIYLDDLVDGRRQPTPQQIVEASCLVNLAHFRLHEIVGDSRTYKQILEDLQVALIGELQDVLLQADQNADREVADYQKNNVLVALCRLIEANSSDNVKLVDFCKVLIPCLQALDDLGDLASDIKDGNLTTIVRLINRTNSSESANYDDIVIEGINSGVFVDYTVKIRQQIYSALALLANSDLAQPKTPAIKAFLEGIVSDLTIAERDFTKLQNSANAGLSRHKIVQEFERIVPLAAQSS